MSFWTVSSILPYLLNLWDPDSVPFSVFSSSLIEEPSKVSASELAIDGVIRETRERAGVSVHDPIVLKCHRRAGD